MDLRLVSTTGSHPYSTPNQSAYESGSVFFNDTSPDAFVPGVYANYTQYNGYAPHQSNWPSEATTAAFIYPPETGSYCHSSSPSSTANSPVYAEPKVCDYFGANSSPYIPTEPVVEYTTHIVNGRVVKRRTTANKKERRRTLSINNAFSNLRDRIPNVPADTKLSKIKTLRLATNYISYLMELLEDSKSSGCGRKSHLMSCEDFKVDLQRFKGGNKADALSHLKLTSGKMIEQQRSKEDCNTPKKGKGRTGWPQT
ncbi:hand-like protein, partial [Dinothrombium tinctorium]